MFYVKTKIKNIAKVWLSKVNAFPSKLYAIKEEYVKTEPIFDTRYIDKKIGDLALSCVSCLKALPSVNKNNIAFLVTYLGDTGGHTELVKNFSQSLPQMYKSKIFLTRKTITEKLTPLKIEELKKYSEIAGVDFKWRYEKQLLNELFKQIVEFSPATLVVFIVNDYFAVGLLALLKKYTQTKIIFCNIASHFSVLGMSYAHLIWEGMPSTAYVTQKYRGFHNTKVLGLCYLTKNKLPAFSESEIATTRSAIGIPKDAFCTMTGCASYKLFENGKSMYLEMIKNILMENESLWHILITKLDKTQESILKKIDMPNRFILMDFKTDYRLYFKCADVFVDSFPLSSALTMVDLMSLKVPFVAFKNKENLALTFYEYFPENYDYLFDNITDMQAGIKKLLDDKDEQKRIINTNFEHFLENFEGDKVAQKVLEANTFDSEINGEQYKDFKGIKLMSRGKLNSLNLF